MDDFVDFSQAGPDSGLFDPSAFDPLLLAEHDPANLPIKSIEDVAGQTPLDAQQQQQQLVDQAFQPGRSDPMITDGQAFPSPEDQSMTDMPNFT